MLGKNFRIIKGVKFINMKIKKIIFPMPVILFIWLAAVPNAYG